MLEFGIHQGTSLCGALDHDLLRLIPVASTSGEAERDLVWDICAHLQRMGYPTMVLDGWSRETVSAPGLADLLDQARWGSVPVGTASNDHESLAVLPAAQGLAKLNRLSAMRGNDHAFQKLHSFFRRYALVVVYAPTETLAAELLEGSCAAPLIVMPDGGQGSVVNAYAQLKLLAMHAGLAATLACPVGLGSDGSAGRIHLDKLCQHAHARLGRAPRGTLVDVSRPADVQRLALALLERAVGLNDVGTPPAIPWSRRTDTVPALATSH